MGKETRVKHPRRRPKGEKLLMVLSKQQCAPHHSFGVYLPNDQAQKV